MEAPKISSTIKTADERLENLLSDDSWKIDRVTVTPIEYRTCLCPASLRRYPDGFETITVKKSFEEYTDTLTFFREHCLETYQFVTNTRK